MTFETSKYSHNFERVDFLRLTFLFSLICFRWKNILNYSLLEKKKIIYDLDKYVIVLMKKDNLKAIFDSILSHEIKFVNKLIMNHLIIRIYFSSKYHVLNINALCAQNKRDFFLCYCIYFLNCFCCQCLFMFYVFKRITISLTTSKMFKFH